ncbi:c-type cytochrome [Actibacterium sp. MT2.3-13A]|uniref:c-type cytochrome n=1 Tax=Actibacterium sp. MT2.3-13A TaxID=2828332 RepID=UPI001BAE00FD|nr:c-type cytochrome [Actibacterium sp. MT2.3-13A]
MKPFFSAVLAASLCTVVPASGAHAAGMTVGEFEYTNSCASCHGAKGDGDGPLASFFAAGGVPQLSLLKKNNGGVFPVSRVYEMVEGTADVRAHGGRAMPVWGDRYRARADPSLDPDFGPADVESYVTFRILALIEYLSTLQAE